MNDFAKLIVCVASVVVIGTHMAKTTNLVIAVNTSQIASVKSMKFAER